MSERRKRYSINNFASEIFTNHNRHEKINPVCVLSAISCDRRTSTKHHAEEFSRVQRYMRLSDKNSEAYAEMKERYIELKVILTASGINLTELDRIKE